MLAKGVTIRGLEVFEALARTGSVAGAAEALSLSQPAVSQQLRNLESALDANLIDHSKRPMQLTPVGAGFLTRAEAALSQLRLGQSELAVVDLADLTALSIGMIDDFDHDLTPRLVTALASSLTKCRFTFITASSLDISEAISGKRLHIAISASTGQVIDGVLEYPLARDPFVLVVPRGTVNTSQDVLAQLSAMPFLRYARDQLISRQIEGHLAAHQLDYPDRFEIGSHLALMALVAQRVGWAITTPLGYMRAARFHQDVEALPLPIAPLSRTISLFAASEWAGQVPEDVGQTVRQLMQAQMIEPAIQQVPWLAGELRLLGV
ncbi:MAG: LysR family transcriptional regulator [Pseudomonadota bacterium]